MERKTITIVLIACLTVFLLGTTPQLSAQIVDSDALLMDIPEPPGARSELPSPIPMVYEFMGGLMAGDYDKCLSNFDVKTFLSILFGRQLRRMDSVEFKELYSYQVQVHRNEFRFLAGVMNRVAKGAKISYSDPRYHQKIQSKVVVKLDTFKGRFRFVIYCRYRDGRWYVYDYVLNNQRLIKTFKSGLGSTRVDTYVSSLRPFYGNKHGYRPIRNKKFDFSIKVPNDFIVKKDVAPGLLATVSAFNAQFLLHIQAATYDNPQTLTQVGKAIKASILPFNPKLYDQWKSDLAGVEIGNVLFYFTKNGKILYTHMVIIPLGKKLIVLNFYHSSLQLLKNMTNLREKMIESISLPKIEAAGGVEEGQFPDEIEANSSSTTNDSGTDFGEIDANKDKGLDSQGDGDIVVTSSSDDSYPEPPEVDSEIPPPAPDESGDMLTPDTYGTSDANDDSYPEPPPPSVEDNASNISDDDEIPPPPPPGSYGDGSDMQSDYTDTPAQGEGNEISF